MPLPGSVQEHVRDSKAIGHPNPGERIEVTIVLRSKIPGTEVRSTQNPGFDHLIDHGYLSRDEFSAAYGLEPGEIAELNDFARAHSLEIVRDDPGSSSIVLSGTAEALADAFGVRLMLYRDARGKVYRGYSGALRLPSELEPEVVGVFGLDNHTIAHLHYTALRRSVNMTYTPQQMARLNNFPSWRDGSGQCIALIELGGGYRQEDVQNYFRWLKVHDPDIVIVPVDGAISQMGGDSDGEVILDIDMAAGVAPGAKIAIYLAPNTEMGFIDAVNAVASDKVNRPSVISISWGAAESNWTRGAIDAMDQAFQACAVMGVTVFSASGDDGSRDNMNDTLSHVDYPASSAYVTGCGGTRLDPTGEVAWNNSPGSATGGGVSEIFSMPSWQSGFAVPPSSNPGGNSGRGVPDISGDADPETGYILLFNGEPAVFGGTSAVAPMYAGLIALFNQELGKPVGYLNPSLYAMYNSSIFSDITSGDNGAYKAGRGWDACTGLGTPDGINLLNSWKARAF